VIPLVNVALMRQCDATAVAHRGVEALIHDAGAAVATEARAMLGTLYGRRIAVLAGPGLNGADGRVAAGILTSRGCKVDVISVFSQPQELRGYDLVIDAAFGLGCSRPYVAPRVAGGTRVLAVDLVSGVNADTGEVLGHPLAADVTLALGALKPAHLDGPAARLAGELRFASLGIDVPQGSGLVDDQDLAHYVRRGVDDHKWTHALTILAGSPSMPGAAALACRGALSAGASMIHLVSRGKVARVLHLPDEVVRVRGRAIDPRSASVAAGPGLGTTSTSWLLERLSGVTVPVVLDADALTLEVVGLKSSVPRILTPHAKEFARLAGAVPGDQRFDAVRRLAAQTGCVVLLKGPVTVIASPSGELRAVNAGTSALATAGSGDVLSGMIAAAIARGHEPFHAASLSAHLHGRAGALLPPFGSAGDLPDAVTRALAGLRGRDPSDEATTSRHRLNRAGRSRT